MVAQGAFAVVGPLLVHSFVSILPSEGLAGMLQVLLGGPFPSSSSSSRTGLSIEDSPRIGFEMSLQAFSLWALLPFFSPASFRAFSSS